MRSRASRPRLRPSSRAIRSPRPDTGYEPSRSRPSSHPKPDPFRASSRRTTKHEAKPSRGGRVRGSRARGSRAAAIPSTPSPSWRPISSHGRPTPTRGAPPGRCRRSSPAAPTGEPVADEDVADEDVAEEQVAEEQVAEEQVAEEQVAEEQVAEEQVAEEQVAEEQVAEEGEVRAEEPVIAAVLDEADAHEPVAEEQMAEESGIGTDVSIEGPELGAALPWRQARPMTGARPSPTWSRSRYRSGLAR